MTIEIENTNQDITVPDYEEIIRRVIARSLAYEDCPYESLVYILLTDNQEIREINSAQRGIDRETDVLSFPMARFPAPGDFRDLETRDPDVFHPGTGELILGDIVISMDRVILQAREYGHSPRRELAFLTAHSMLHLMGYDHMTDKESAIMEAKQEEILRLCGYTREEA